MSNHQSFAVLAEDLIGEHGRNVTLRSFVESGHPSSPTRTPVDTTVKALSVKVNYSELDGTLVKIGDKAYLMSSKVQPDVDMRIIDGRELSIVSVTETKPGDQTIMYRVIARG